MSNNFEEQHSFLHEFFCAGGQVHFNVPSDYSPSGRTNAILWPNDWEYDTAAVDKARILAEQLIESRDYFPSLTPEEIAGHLRISKRKVYELIRMAAVGGIKRSGVWKIYRPSVSAYLDRLSSGQKRRCWYDA